MWKSVWNPERINSRDVACRILGVGVEQQYQYIYFLAANTDPAF